MNPMVRLTFVYAGFLFALGAGAYLMTRTSVTALIPAFFSAPFFLLAGLSLLGEKWRMHCMHISAAFALFVIGALGMMFLQRGIQFNLASMSQLAMFLATIVYLGASIRSFIMARRNRLKG